MAGNSGINVGFGTSGYVLTSNGDGSLPTFQPAPSSTVSFLGVLGSTENITFNRPVTPVLRGWGSSVAWTEVYDNGGGFYPGDGAGSDMDFTAPSNGVYCFYYVMQVNQSGQTYLSSPLAYIFKPHVTTPSGSTTKLLSLSVTLSLSIGEVVKPVWVDYDTGGPTFAQAVGTETVQSTFTGQLSWFGGFKV